MARLVVTTQGIRNPVIELHLGANRLGRDSSNDFQIEHPTVSARHCELILTDSAVVLRDCDSTNGTFVDGKAIKETGLRPGQTLRLGSVELLVETTEVVVAIPRFDLPVPAPPVVRRDGAVLCPRHSEAPATYRCTHCREMMCDSCVHTLRRQGGKVLRLCPLCSHAVERLGLPPKPRKQSFFAKLTQTVRLPFLHKVKRKEP